MAKEENTTHTLKSAQNGDMSATEASQRKVLSMDESVSLREKYSDAFEKQAQDLAQAKSPEERTEVFWRALGPMTPAERLSFRRTEEWDYEKSFRLDKWTKNPRNGVTQNFLVLPHYAMSGHGEQNTNIPAFDPSHNSPLITASELCWLSDVSYALKLGSDLSELFRTVKTEDGWRCYFSTGVGTRVALVLLTIGKLYLQKGKAFLLDASGEAYVVPFSKLSDPMTYTRSVLTRYHKESAWTAIQIALEARWAGKKQAVGYSTQAFSASAVQTEALLTLGYKNRENSPFFINPFESAVQTGAIAVQNGKLPNLQKVSSEGFEGRRLKKYELAFIDMMSKGVSWTGTEDMITAEGYRIKILLYMLESFLKESFVDSEGKRLYEYFEGEEGPQGMMVLYGKQGVGKSTLVKKLSLGWSKTIVNLDITDQATVYARASAPYVEYAELEKMSTKALNALKSFLTMYLYYMNLKYQNGTVRFTFPALIIGTTNDPDFLADRSGERRFWPIVVDSFDFKKYGTKAILTILANAQLDLNRTADGLYSEYVETRDSDKYFDSMKDLLSLRLIETPQELEEKQKNFSRYDTDTKMLDDFIYEAVKNPTGTLSEVVLGHNSEYFYFTDSKRALEKAFDVWIHANADENSDINPRVYRGKISAYLYGLPTAKQRVSHKLKKGSSPVKATRISIGTISQLVARVNPRDALGKLTQGLDHLPKSKTGVSPRDLPF